MLKLTNTSYHLFVFVSSIFPFHVQWESSGAALQCRVFSFVFCDFFFAYQTKVQLGIKRDHELSTQQLEHGWFCGLHEEIQFSSSSWSINV